MTCTVDRGLSISEVATTVQLIVLDEDDNAPIAQRNKHFLNGSELKEVSCVFLVDFLILWQGFFFFLMNFRGFPPGCCYSVADF